MDGSLVDQAELRPDPNPLVGKEMVDGLVMIDQGQWLDDLRKKIKERNPQTDGEKIALADEIVRTTLKDAIHAKSNHAEYEQHRKAIDNAWSDSPKKMSAVVEGGYGVCRDFHVLGLVALEEMGVESAFYGNPRYRHTFLETKIAGQWQPFDPFAQVYFQNEDGQARFFPTDCYRGSEVVFFGKTSHAKDVPNLDQPAPNPAKISLDSLRARAQGGKVSR